MFDVFDRDKIIDGRGSVLAGQTNGAHNFDSLGCACRDLRLATGQLLLAADADHLLESLSGINIVTEAAGFEEDGGGGGGSGGRGRELLKSVLSELLSEDHE